ncbi:MAG: hypothetical protein K1X89_25550 [Myxococcaceae bacterium]|nr:hypothetical protein [Myxococcaceae bacterium]
MSGVYEVPKRKVQVTLLAGRLRSKAALFVDLVGPAVEAEAVRQMLDRAEPFVAAELPSGEVTFVATSAVEALLVSGSADGVPLEHEAQLELELQSGARLGGRVRYTLPADRARVLDFLNQERGFIALEVPEGQWLVSAAKVVGCRLPRLAKASPSPKPTVKAKAKPRPPKRTKPAKRR